MNNKLNNIFTPKSGDDIIEDCNPFVLNKMLASKIKDYDNNKNVLIEIISNNSFNSTIALNQIFLEICKYDIVELAQIILDKPGFDPSFDNNLPFRIALNHTSTNITDILYKHMVTHGYI